MSKKKILFITWDGPQTSYMEGLFMPIFSQIQKHNAIEFHVMQFTWSDENRLKEIQHAAASLGIRYVSRSIERRISPTIGSLLTLFTGNVAIAKYVKKHSIDVIMPRSTYPAYMVNRLAKNDKIKIIFDADGLPIEEKVDFNGLSPKGLQYSWLKKIEKKALIAADYVLTRSCKSIDVHLHAIGERFRSKFFKVLNGRDAAVFKADQSRRSVIREELKFLDEEKVFVYCGSLGPQYGWDLMLGIFKRYRKDFPAKWLILTGDLAFLGSRIPEELKNDIVILKVPADQVPKYLNIADIAFAIRQPSFSMQGVAPIKLGEYLLMGLPTIASKAIGDTEALLKDYINCFLYDHNLDDITQMEMIFKWITQIKVSEKHELRDMAVSEFSITSASESYMKAFKMII